MAFTNAVLAANADLPAGEVIKASPYNVAAFEVFEDGLIEGRFCKFDTGSIDNLDSSATPIIAGIARRKITGEIGTGIYSTTGIEIDSLAEVINFGYATVTVTDSATPTKMGQVYAVNADTVDRGKATDDSGQLEIPGAIFWEEKADNVWLVRVMMGVESSIAYAAAPTSLEVTAVDNTDGTATLTVQALAFDGTDLAASVLTRVWVGTADDLGVDAITGITIATGTSKEVVTANAEYLVITDATGLAELTLNNGGAGTIYAWVESSSVIYPSGAIVITSI